MLSTIISLLTTTWETVRHVTGEPFPSALLIESLSPRVDDGPWSVHANRNAATKLNATYWEPHAMPIHHSRRDYETMMTMAR